MEIPQAVIKVRFFDDKELRLLYCYCCVGSARVSHHLPKPKLLWSDQSMKWQKFKLDLLFIEKVC